MLTHIVKEGMGIALEMVKDIRKLLASLRCSVNRRNSFNSICVELGLNIELPSLLTRLRNEMIVNILHGASMLQGQTDLKRSYCPRP